MSTHFCKVGKIKPNVNKLISIKAIEDKAVQLAKIVSKKKNAKDLDVAS